MQSTEERFWSKVCRTETCWEWTAAASPLGYGKFWDGTRTVLAHRFSYSTLRGIPAGLHLDHLCRNPSCVNPDHLEPVTQAENTRRGEAGDAINHLKTHCPAGHPYDAVNTYLWGGRRQCRACRSARREISRARAKAGFTPTIPSACRAGHPYTEENTYRRPDGGRTCQTCRRERRRKNATS